MMSSQTLRTEPQTPASRAFLAKRAAGLLFALASLVWVFHDMHPRQLIATMHVAHWQFVAASIVFDVLTYVLQGMRWNLLLRPVGRIGASRATQAIYAGLFTNEVVPLRFGELVRAFLASRSLGVRISDIFPSMVVERFLDALWLVAGVGMAAMFLPLPKTLLEAGDVLGAIVLAAGAVFAWLVVRKERELERTQSANTATEGTAPRSLKRFVAQLAAGIRDIGSSRNLCGAALLSVAMLVAQGLAVWYMMLACDIRLSIFAGAAVMLIVRLGTAIPNAPANVGSFQFFTVLALGLFGIDKTVAAGFSIVDFAVLTLPLWTLGLISIARAGMTLGRIRSEIAVLRKQGSLTA